LREALPYFEKAAQLGDSVGAQAVVQLKQNLGMGSAPQKVTLLPLAGVTVRYQKI